MSLETSEQARKLSGVVQLGRVAAIDTGANTVRVRIGDLITHPIPVAQLRSGSVRIQFMPSVGEQVVVYAPGGDMARAFVQGSVPQSGGAVAAGAPGPVIHLGGATLSVIGDLDITGDVTVTGSVAISKDLSVGGNFALSGSGVSQGDITSGGVSLQTHVHGGIDRGSSNTDKPS